MRTPGGIVARLGESIQGGGGYHALTSGLVDTDVPGDCAAAAGAEAAVLNGDG